MACAGTDMVLSDESESGFVQRVIKEEAGTR